MKITCEQLGKRYNRQWVFRNFDAVFQSEEKVAIVGNNGSGKSTFLKILMGFERFSEGSLSYEMNQKPVDETKVNKLVSLCAPYQQLYEDFTLEEHYNLHASFKALTTQNFEHFQELIALPNTKKKNISKYSSGMKQRVKLGLAVLCDTPLLFLDEPTSNLDARSIKWFQDLVLSNLKNRILFVASNSNQEELFCCQREITIENYLK